MTDHKTRSGSLQFYPRVRAKKVIPSVNWRNVSEKNADSKKVLGFIGYKVGMVSVAVKDNTPDSMVKGKRVVIPSTIIECPLMKIFSIRLYKGNKLLKDILVSNDKLLKRKVKVSKNIKADKIEEEVKDIDFDDVRVVVYSDVASTNVGKKKPDMIEIALGNGMNKEEKINFIKEKLKTGISVTEVFEDTDQEIVDVRGVTKGYGTQGPVKRFGITLKASKSEKGQRRPGSLAPWHPARVTFRAPQAGQTGYHNRITYNNLVIKVGKISESDINKKEGFNRYGNLKTEYIIVKGSIPGAKKRAIVITKAIRPTKHKRKRKFEIIEVR